MEVGVQIRAMHGVFTDNFQASTVTAQVAIQLARWGGLKVVAVADKAKHGRKLEALGARMIPGNVMVCFC
jgi:hypothetical protein